MPDPWQSPIALPPLAPGELQLWRVTLAEATASPRLFMQHLSPDETERAARLRAGEGRMQFVVARACLRSLLGSAFAVAPRLVPITLGSHGKPATPASDGNSLHFNVAHSHGSILIALSGRGPVGVDLERIDPNLDVMEIAGNSFTPGETQQLAGISDPDQRQRAFFRCWTRKEAVVKADGRGLSLPLTSFEVPVLESAISHPVSLVWSGEETQFARTQLYFVADVPLGDEFSGALALERQHNLTQMFDFPIAAV